MDDAFPTVNEDTPLSMISTLLGYEPAVLVTKKGHVVGIITRDGLLRALAQKDHQLVRDVMDRDIAMADASDMLESAFQRLQECACQTLPVLRNQRLVGLLNAEHLGEFLMIRTALNGQKAVDSH